MTEGGDSSDGNPISAVAAEPEEPGPITLEVVHDDGAWPGLGKYEARAAAAARAVGLHGRLESGPLEAALALSSDARVQAMNRDYRGMDKPTNVLSFPTGESQLPPEGARWLGDIVIAEETLIREAQERGVPTLDHFSHLVVHGLMHLIGYDHETDDDARDMEARETAILAGLGIADPYHEEETVGPTG